MRAAPKSYILPIFMALLMHGGIVLLTASTWFESSSDQRRVIPRYVQAELVDLRSLSQTKDDTQRKADAKKKADSKKKADAKKKADSKKRTDAKKKADAKKKTNAMMKAEAKKKADAKNKADAKKETEQKAKQEQLNRAAALKKAKQQADDARQEAAANKQAEQAEIERQQQAERELQALEQERRLAAQAEAEQAWAAQAEQLVASAESVIIKGVQSQWRRPPSARNGMIVGVRIHLLPTGEVDDAYVTSPSGDEAFDRSAVNAVLKAERFPALQGIDPVVFDRYLRQITLTFRPEDLRR